MIFGYLGYFEPADGLLKDAERVGGAPPRCDLRAAVQQTLGKVCLSASLTDEIIKDSQSLIKHVQPVLSPTAHFLVMTHRPN